MVAVVIDGNVEGFFLKGDVNGEQWADRTPPTLRSMSCAARMAFFAVASSIAKDSCVCSKAMDGACTGLPGALLGETEATCVVVVAAAVIVTLAVAVVVLAAEAVGGAITRVGTACLLVMSI